MKGLRSISLCKLSYYKEKYFFLQRCTNLPKHFLVYSVKLKLYAQSRITMNKLKRNLQFYFNQNYQSKKKLFLIKKKIHLNSWEYLHTLIDWQWHNDSLKIKNKRVVSFICRLWSCKIFKTNQIYNFQTKLLPSWFFFIFYIFSKWEQALQIQNVYLWENIFCFKIISSEVNETRITWQADCLSNILNKYNRVREIFFLLKKKTLAVFT